MREEAKSIAFLEHEGRLIVPFFQRSYVWETENWERLLDELTKIRKPFLGAVILRQLTPISGKPKHAEIIDGQQRLITISLLVKALLDTITDRDDLVDDLVENKDNIKSSLDNIKVFLKRLIYSMTPRGAIESPKIEPSIKDVREYEKIIMSEKPQVDCKEEYKHKMVSCYCYFREKLQNLSKEELDILLENLQYTYPLVVIDLQPEDDPQLIFDAINTGGVKLTPAEIVKNSLYETYRKLSAGDIYSAKEYYEKTWEREFEREHSHFWDEEITKLPRRRIDFFLQSFALLEGFLDPESHDITDLPKLYKEKLANFKEVKHIEDFVNEILRYAEHYRDKLQIQDIAVSFDEYEPRLLIILKELNTFSFDPFILYVYENKDEETRKKLFHLLESFVLLNALVGFESTKGYSSLCKQLIEGERQIANNSYNSGNVLCKRIKELLSKEFIEKSLHSVKSKVARLILFWIELYLRKKEDADIKELRYGFTLEHIMPRNWEKHWNLDLVPHPNKNLTPEEQIKDREEKINWLGNLTLISGQLNTEISNMDFKVKIEGKGKKKGIKDRAELLITKDILKAYEEKKIWNEEYIEQRTKRLLDIILEIWYYPICDICKFECI